MRGLLAGVFCLLTTGLAECGQEAPADVSSGLAMDDIKRQHLETKGSKAVDTFLFAMEREMWMPIQASSGLSSIRPSLSIWNKRHPPNGGALTNASIAWYTERKGGVPVNNEDKILALLEQMNGRLDTMDGRLDSMDGRLDTMEGRLDTMDGRLDTMEGRLDRLERGQAEIRADVAVLKEDVETIKEDAQITRSATNTLLDWAEQTQVEVRIPLYKKAE